MILVLCKIYVIKIMAYEYQAFLYFNKKNFFTLKRFIDVQSRTLIQSKLHLCLDYELYSGRHIDVQLQ